MLAVALIAPLLLGQTYMGGGLRQNSQTGNYKATSNDCGARVVFTVSAQATLTLEPPSDYQTDCDIVVSNAGAYPGAGRGVILSVSGLSLGQPILYPGQNTAFSKIDGVWKETSNARNRWKPAQSKVTSPLTLYIDCADGSDNNDGLAPGAGNAFQTPTHAWVISSRYIDVSGGSTQITWSSTGQSCGGLHMAASIPGGEGNAALTWQGNRTTTITTSPCIALFNYAWLELNGVACVDTTAEGCYSVTSYSHLSFIGGESSCTTSGGTGLVVTNYGTIESINTGFAFSAGANNPNGWALVGGHSNLVWDASETLDINSNVTFAQQTLMVSQQSSVNFGGSSFNLHGNTVKGTRFACSHWSLIFGTANAPNRFIPGSLNGNVGSDCETP
jgi:hypothetical protein